VKWHLITAENWRIDPKMKFTKQTYGDDIFDE